jgi:hypothetical protein
MERLYEVTQGTLAMENGKGVPRSSGHRIPAFDKSNTVSNNEISLLFLEFGGEGGSYRSIFRNSLRFCHFTHKIRVFCRLLPSLSSRMCLSNAL